MRLRRSIMLVLASAAIAACARDGGTSEDRQGKVTIVYQDEDIRPENKAAIAKLRASGVFERMAERLNSSVALPHDLEIVVSDELNTEVPTTEVDGRRIIWPAAFTRETLEALNGFVPQVASSEKGVPKAIAAQDFTPDQLNLWSNQFILGHELGHAVIHQLGIPLTGLEENSADGFATFFTVNDQDTGTNAVLGGAVLFDAMSVASPELAEDYASDHPIIVQRVYNFLCAALGRDPRGLQSLVSDGLVPEERAWLCDKEWAQLNNGWWTVLEPHLTTGFAKESEARRQEARKALAAADKEFAERVKRRAADEAANGN